VLDIPLYLARSRQMSSQAENQLGFFGDIKEFAGTALLLCFLAQFCWIGTILREIISTLSFGRAVRKQKRGPKTLCILSSGEADAGDDIQNLERLQVTVILNQMVPDRPSCPHILVLPLTWPAFSICWHQFWSQALAQRVKISKIYSGK